MAYTLNDELRLFQVGNTSSSKNTEVKQLGPWLVRNWMGDHSGVGRGCCNYKHYEIPKAEKRGLHSTVCMLLGQKKKI